jgi:hypothetical protein
MSAPESASSRPALKTAISLRTSAIWIGTALAVAMGIVPPWRYTLDMAAQHYAKPAGYAPIWEPPLPPPSYPTLLAQVRAEYKEYAEMSDDDLRIRLDSKLPEGSEARRDFLKRNTAFSIRLDYERLLLQWAMIGIVICAVLATGKFGTRGGY